MVMEDCDNRIGVFHFEFFQAGAPGEMSNDGDMVFHRGDARCGPSRIGGEQTVVWRIHGSGQSDDTALGTHLDGIRAGKP
jgi:hypothetical protein